MIVSGHRLPDFLIIGAMKAGTTTLYHDLKTHDRLYLPDIKEPHALCHEDISSRVKIIKYSALFKSARDDQLCGEGSTGYTKRPTMEGIADRARRLLGPELKVIYIVREPIERIVSQHHHEFMTEGAPCDIETALNNDSRYVHYSRYAWQLEPWLEALGRSNVYVMHFESYIANRQDTVEDACKFLGVGALHSRINEQAVFNRSEGRPVPRGVWARLQHSPLYRKVIRPMTPTRVREALLNCLPKGPPRPAPPSPETVDRLLDQLEQDMEQLRVIMNRTEPVWDSEKIRSKWRKRHQQWIMGVSHA